MRRAYKASKLARLDNATPAQVNAIEQVGQAIVDSGEKLFPEFPKVAKFVEDLPNNPLPNGAESLRGQYTKALAELDDDALRTLNVDLDQHPN